jgi:endonuclease/exonuclease/phosphatase family metal-dependent hydrolase
MAALCGKDWLGATAFNSTIFCGDFNALPHSPVCRRVREELRDVQLSLDCHNPLHTLHSPWPLGRIDHIFVSRDLEILKVEVPTNRLEKIASDHLPLITELRILEDNPKA